MVQHDEKFMFGMVKVGARGQIVIPKEARELFGIQAGDSLLILGDKATGLAIIRKELGAEIMQSILNREGGFADARHSDEGSDEELR